MNPRLDGELLLQRHAGLMLAVLLVFASLGLAGGYVFWTSTGQLPGTSVDESYRTFEQRYGAFRALLIPRSELAAKQPALIESALRHDLQPGRIDYAVTQNLPGRFCLASVQLPVRGAYKDVRAFVIEALVTHPALSIEELSIQRISRDGQIEARLRLAFYATAGEVMP